MPGSAATLLHFTCCRCYACSINLTLQESLLVIRPAPRQVPGREAIRLRCFGYHPRNANTLWPGNAGLATWMDARKALFDGRRVLELGTGTGALAIFLHQLGALVSRLSAYQRRHCAALACSPARGLESRTPPCSSLGLQQDT